MYHFAHRHFVTAGLLVFGLESYVILSNLSPKGFDLLQILAALDDVRSSLPRAVMVSPSSHRYIDVSSAHASHNVDHCDTIIHLSSSLWRED